MRLFPGGGEGRELVLEAGWGLTTKGTGSRHGWAGHRVTCTVDLTVPASPLGGAEHTQALKCPQWDLVVGLSQCLRPHDCY